MTGQPFIIAADDATGALDAGMQLLQMAGTIRFIRGARPAPELLSGADVAILSTESRNLSAHEAGERTRALMDVPVRYKKLDSTLRGNIGAELRALHESGRWDAYLICPALPEAGRTTRDGVHYVNGIPLHLTELANDPFAPVASSDIREIIGADLPLIVPDAQTRGDLDAIAARYQDQRRVLMCGSAGLLGSLRLRLGDPALRRRPRIGPPAPQLLISASPAAATKGQIAHLIEHNPRARLIRPELSRPGKPDWDAQCARMADAAREALALGQHAVIDLAAASKAALSGQDADRLRRDSKAILALAAQLCRALTDMPLRTLYLLGGDTLCACMDAMGARGIDILEQGLPMIPVCALIGGHVPDIPVITKAGGFGARDALTTLVERMDALEPNE